jgi:hypothetical protein
VDYKKNAYWIGLAVVVVIILVGYMFMVPPVEAEADTARQQCESQIDEVRKKAENPQSIKTPMQKNMAEDYKKTVVNQMQSILKEMSEWKFKPLYSEKAVLMDLEFDKWLNEKRGELNAMTKGMETFPELQKLMFDGPGEATDSKSDNQTKQPKYRIRRMIIVEEILKTLTEKQSLMEIASFKPGEQPNTEVLKSDEVPAGAFALKSLEILDPKAAMSRPQSIEGVQKEIFERVRGTTRGGGTGANTPRPAEMPYNYHSVDMIFTAQLAAVPKILKKLEGTDVYHAVITRVDFTREVAPFPKLTDVAERGPSPANTYFREAPVRVLVSFDIYEYDERKAADLRARVGL